MSSDNKLSVAFDWMKNWRDLFIDQFFWKQACKKKKKTPLPAMETPDHTAICLHSPPRRKQRKKTHPEYRVILLSFVCESRRGAQPKSGF